MTPAWEKDSFTFLARRTDLAGGTDERDSGDSSDNLRSAVVKGGVNPKARAPRRRSGQRLRRLLEANEQGSLSDYMNYLGMAALAPTTDRRRKDAVSE